MRGLLRLGAWGTAATVALTVMVFTAMSSTGSQRLMTALSPSPNQATAAVPSVPVARFRETEAETKKLAEAVRSLHSDRERLLARIDTLERNLEDVTGSIRRQAARAPAVQPEAPATAAAPATSRAPPASVPASPGMPNQNAEPAQDAEAADARPAQGVDVGGAVSLEGLRALWNSTRTTNAGAVEGLKPVVVVRENTKTRNSELRLVLGPLANAAAAAHVCAMLTAARRYCQLVPYEGQQLAFAAAAPAAKRPPAAQEKKPATPTPQRAPARPNP